MESAKVYPSEQKSGRKQRRDECTDDCFKTQTSRSSPRGDPHAPLQQQTEKAYVLWIKRYIFFHNKRHPLEMAEPEIAQFLSSLATEGRVSASTQNQAFNALFLYNEVLSKKIGLIDGIVRAKRPQRLPVVLTKDEVKRVLDRMSGAPHLMGLLLYGAGLRLMGMLSPSSQRY